MRTATQPRYRPLRNTETSFADLTNNVRRFVVTARTCCCRIPPQHIDSVIQDRRSDKQYGAEDANRVPVKSVVLAVALLVIGSILLTLGALHLRGHIYSKDGAVSLHHLSLPTSLTYIVVLTPFLSLRVLRQQ